ncbi:hypothetical protein R50072_29910 [Simiduia litorea]|uniref:hypothetical protein n=1 Tax=Simiduia litorea TaxID=1435348 RepID=UPI0036F2A3FC
MDISYTYFFLAFIVLALWIIPASVLTFKVASNDVLPRSFKRQLIMPMWYVPLVGNLVCYVQFAKLGKLQSLSAAEHRSIWAAYRSTRR